MALRKQEQHSKEYLAMNPLGKVPCLQVGMGMSMALYCISHPCANLSAKLHPKWTCMH